MWQTIRISLRSYRRNFRKHWIYNLLNIGGLSIAFICLCLIIAYIFHETSYDRFNSKADRIFRPTYQMQSDNGFAVHWARIPDDYINELPNDIPEIAKLIRFQNQEQKYIRVGEERFKPRHAYTTDAEVFEVFDFKIVDGAVSDGLLQPYSVVLTETLARRYFGKTDVIGKQIYVTGDWTPEEQPYTVTAVMADLPANTHLPVELLFSFKNAEERSGWAYVYTLLQENASIEQVQSKMGAFVSKYQDPDATMKVDIVFQPLTGIHLTSNLAREIKPISSLFYVRIFWGVGLFIWLIALVNFSNLSSALALTKGKEAGVRKILGAQRRHLVMSALGDSIIGSLMALLIAILIAWWCLPGFEMLTGTSLLPQFSRVLPILLSVSVVSGIIAGLVPAFMMYGIDILRVLKESNQWSWKQKGYTANVKKTMVMLQFTATIVLLSGALIARQQFAFIQKKNLGMNAEQVVAIAQVPDAVKQKYPLFKDRVSNLSGVAAVAACMEVPSREIRDSGPVVIKGSDQDATQAPLMDIQVVDPDFIQMMDLKFLAGSDFSRNLTLAEIPEFTEDMTPARYLVESPRKYIINETAMRQLGWSDPRDAIGREVKWSIGSFELAYGPITGVVEDYHQESLKNEVDPIIMAVEPLWLGTFLVKVNGQQITQTLKEIERIWNDLFPYSFEFNFLDDLFDELYKKDQAKISLLLILTLVAIFISFIGLISLVAFTLNTRSRELAIRRVIGANLTELIRLIGRDYFLFIGMASLLAIPISYYYVRSWLNDFAYHINISPFFYVQAVALIFFILLCILTIQVFKASRLNPVEALHED